MSEGMKVLIAYDGSECAEAALDDLQRAGLPREAEALVGEAERWGADCIFVGARGSGKSLGRFLLGSVSAAVAARAHCSVEVTREL